LGNENTVRVLLPEDIVKVHRNMAKIHAVLAMVLRREHDVELMVMTLFCAEAEVKHLLKAVDEISEEVLEPIRDIAYQLFREGLE